MTEQQAMRMALEYVESVPDDRYNAEHIDRDALITALRQALEQVDSDCQQCGGKGCVACDARKQQPADDWKNSAIRLGEELSSVGPDGYYDMNAKQWLDWAMEQNPKGKNSLSSDEPVAWMWYVNNGAGYVSRGIGFYQTDIPFAKHTPLYTRPQPADKSSLFDSGVYVGSHIGKEIKHTSLDHQPWVGLTDEEIDQGLCRTNYAMQTAGAWRDGAEWAMNQLKEKNHG